MDKLSNETVLEKAETGRTLIKRLQNDKCHSVKKRNKNVWSAQESLKEREQSAGKDEVMLLA